KLSLFKRVVPEQVADTKGESEDIKKKRLSKGKDIDGLLSVVGAARMPDKAQLSHDDHHSGSSGHEGDIIHYFDHADNEAYDDIVWYDGPHRDDEDEHGHGDSHHGYEEDNHHYDDHHDEPHESMDPSPRMYKSLLPNFSQHGGAKAQGLSSKGSDPGAQIAFEDPHQHGHEHSDQDGGGPPGGGFQHSGAELLTGVISPREFCLRLKHECESTCREFRAGVEYLSTTCAAGSVAELLFWGKCCQIGQEQRTQMMSNRLHAELEEQQSRWRQERLQA
ncbi:hypothetical protein BGZ98_000206, partial [Dissophora globulifera]